MQKWNFNVTIPLFDWVHRTTVSRELIETTLAEDAEALKRQDASPVAEDPGVSPS